jgi:hypothetical protein
MRILPLALARSDQRTSGRIGSGKRAARSGANEAPLGIRPLASSFLRGTRSWLTIRSRTRPYSNFAGHHDYRFERFCRLANRTPRPPPFCAMNSIPASSRAFRIASITERMGRRSPLSKFFTVPRHAAGGDSRRVGMSQRREHPIGGSAPAGVLGVVSSNLTCPSIFLAESDGSVLAV